MSFSDAKHNSHWCLDLLSFYHPALFICECKYTHPKTQYVIKGPLWASLTRLINLLPPLREAPLALLAKANDSAGDGRMLKSPTLSPPSSRPEHPWLPWQHPPHSQ